MRIISPHTGRPLLHWLAIVLVMTAAGSAWAGIKITTRAAVSLQAPDNSQPVYGVVWMNARADVDIAWTTDLTDFDTLLACAALADSGCLVLAPAHEGTTADCLRQMSVLFGVNQAQAREILAEHLQAVVATTLVPQINSREPVGAYEILIVTLRTRAIIKESRGDIAAQIKDGRSLGMQTLDDSIVRHYQADRISYDEAWFRVQDKDALGPAPRK